MEIGYHICHINRISDLCCCGVISICDLCILVIFRAAIIFFVAFFVITVVLVDSCKLGFCLSQDLIIRNLGLFCIRQCLISCTYAIYLRFICCCDRSACQCFDLPDHRLYLCRVIPGRCSRRRRCCSWLRCFRRRRCRCICWLRRCSWFRVRCSSYFRFRCSCRLRFCRNFWFRFTYLTPVS